MSDANAHRAVRIELATSELEGGRCRAWADPGQVLTVLALGSQHDLFERVVEPRLRELTPYDAEEPAVEADAPDAPPLVRQLVRCLHDLHTRLYRENRSLMREPRWIELTCALAEEERVYFLKGAPAWICVLRDEQAFPVGTVPAADAASTGACLGRSERLALELTSLAVQPGDTVIALSADGDLAPDLPAVRNLFARTPDLKRACDGLVDLLGLQSQGACVVAFRFLPVGAVGEAGPVRVNPLEDLIVGLDLLPASTAIPSAREPVHFDEWAAEETPAAALGEPELPAAPRMETPERAAPDTETARLAPPPEFDGEDAPQAFRWRRYWPALVGAVLVGLVLFAAIPGRGGSGGRAGFLGKALSGGVRGPALGRLEVASEPPALSVLLNGETVAEGTPAVVDSVPAGRQRVGLDLGPCGIWETEVEIRAGSQTRLAPTLTGAVEVVAEEPAAGGRVWVQGRSKRAIPAVIDSLTVGWNRIFYEDDRVPLWDRLVLVKADRTTRVVVPNQRRSESGMLRIEALLYQEQEGLVESTGDSVWIDGSPDGRTPREVSLRPGLHSVRVGSAATGYSSEVLDMKAGSLRYLQAQLGRGELPALRHVAPGRVLVRGPVLLSMAVSGGDGSVWTRPTLHLPEMAPGLREIPMSPVETSDRVYVGVVQPENLPVGRDVTYYFTVVGPDGQTVWSDLYRLRPESSWSPSPSHAGAIEEAATDD